MPKEYFAFYETSAMLAKEKRISATQKGLAGKTNQDFALRSE